MTEGIDEIATMRIVNGIQNQSTPMAAPVSIEAEGTTPIRREWEGASWRGSGSSRVIATMPST
ncbi:hypothetical protein TUM20984_15000 [Mycobacterium antarcticum]|nr:hypothetical protein TUM20984_15000 [Mycolicibacterium sp. TUM20984]